MATSLAAWRASDGTSLLRERLRAAAVGDMVRLKTEEDPARAAWLRGRVSALEAAYDMTEED